MNHRNSVNAVREEFSNVVNTLAVDTSSRVLSLALRSRNSDTFEANLEGTPRHSEQLLDLIGEGLNHLGLRKEELDRLIWGLGPGSFTGLRIGLSVLKGLRLGLGKKSFGVSSLDLIALGSGIVNGNLAVCVDARRERIYAAMYRFRNGSVEKIIPDSLFSFDELKRRIKPETVVTGDALEPYGALLRESVGEQVTFLSSSFWYPRAIFSIELAEKKREWLKPLSLRAMQPAYLRSSEAEEKGRRTPVRRRG